jgi:hypothetical protein
MTVQRKLKRLRKRMERVRLFVGLSGRFAGLATLARMERVQWRLERILARKRSAA